LLADAQGVAIVPNMVRGAFVIGLQHGRGVLLVRDEQKAWSAPRMIQITGGSLGWQAGVQATDLVLVFRTKQSVANLMRGKLTIGVDAAAAAGPVGRKASAATDLPLQSEILSYSRARGAFVGVSIDGSSITLDPTAEARYYQPLGQVDPSAPIPGSATRLVQLVSTVSAGGGELPTAAAPPAGVQPNAAPPPGELERTRQQLDAVSRRLAAILDDTWRQYLALPPEIYTPHQLPDVAALEQAIARYDAVARQPAYATLQARQEFQETLRWLTRLREMQTSGDSQLALPSPPNGVPTNPRAADSY
jgi:hypothetical protein